MLEPVFSHRKSLFIGKDKGRAFRWDGLFPTRRKSGEIEVIVLTTQRNCSSEDCILKLLTESRLIAHRALIRCKTAAEIRQKRVLLGCLNYRFDIEQIFVTRMSIHHLKIGRRSVLTFFLSFPA